jgi:hypothetical protein
MPKLLHGGGTMRGSRLVVCGVAIIMTVLVGCQSAPKGPTDEEQIAGLLADLETAIEGGDLEAMMSLYSESYQGQRGEDKAGLRTFLDQAKAMGYLEGIDADVSGAEVTVEEGTATAGPVALQGAMGTQTMTLNLTKEESGWLIVGSQMQ